MKLIILLITIFTVQSQYVWKVQRTFSFDYIREYPVTQSCTDVKGAIRLQGNGCVCPFKTIFHVGTGGLEAGCFSQEMLCDKESTTTCYLGYGIIKYSNFSDGISKKVLRFVARGDLPKCNMGSTMHSTLEEWTINKWKVFDRNDRIVVRKSPQFREIKFGDENIESGVLRLRLGCSSVSKDYQTYYIKILQNGTYLYPPFITTTTTTTTSTTTATTTKVSTTAFTTTATANSTATTSTSTTTTKSPSTIIRPITTNTTTFATSIPDIKSPRTTAKPSPQQTDVKTPTVALKTATRQQPATSTTTTTTTLLSTSPSVETLTTTPLATNPTVETSTTTILATNPTVETSTQPDTSLAATTTSLSKQHGDDDDGNSTTLLEKTSSKTDNDNDGEIGVVWYILIGVIVVVLITIVVIFVCFSCRSKKKRRRKKLMSQSSGNTYIFDNEYAKSPNQREFVKDGVKQPKHQENAGHCDQANDEIYQELSLHHENQDSYQELCPHLDPDQNEADCSLSENVYHDPDEVFHPSKSHTSTEPFYFQMDYSDGSTKHNKEAQHHDNEHIYHNDGNAETNFTMSQNDGNESNYSYEDMGGERQYDNVVVPGFPHNDEGRQHSQPNVREQRLSLHFQNNFTELTIV